jgi:hypothetical protein
MNSTLNTARGLTCFPLGNHLNGIRPRTTTLRLFTQTSTSRCPIKSPHRRVSTDSKGIAGLLGIGVQNLGSWQMGVTLSHLRHCFVRLPSTHIRDCARLAAFRVSFCQLSLYLRMDCSRYLRMVSKCNKGGAFAQQTKRFRSPRVVLESVNLDGP